MNRKLALIVFAIVASSCTCLFADTATISTFTPTRFTVEVRGQGPDVVLIPGLACSRAVYEKEADLLVSHYKLHLVQIDGFGDAPAGPNATGPILAPVETELAEYIEANHLQKPAVIGHSLGGLLGLMLAADHPNDVGKLLVVDSLPFLGSLFDPNATVDTTRPQADKMKQYLEAQSEVDFAAGEHVTLARMVKSGDGLKSVTAWALASDRKVVADAMYDDMTTDMRPKLGSIKAPITLLYPYDPVMGTQDEVDAVYKTAYAAAPSAKLVRIPNSYHFIMLDQPQAFADAVDAFLKN